MSGVTENNLAVLPEADLYYREAMHKIEGLDGVEQTRVLRHDIKDQYKAVKTGSAVLHSRVRLLFELNPDEAYDFLGRLPVSEKRSLFNFVTSADQTLREDRTAIATIQTQWPAWDWTLPNGRTPATWSHKMLKDLRYLALRLEDFETLFRYLDGIIVERMSFRRGRQGASKGPLLRDVDMKTLKERVRSGEEISINLSVCSRESSEMSIENARADPAAAALNQNQSFSSWLSGVPGQTADRESRGESSRAGNSTFRLESPDFEEEEEEEGGDGDRSGRASGEDGPGSPRAGDDAGGDEDEDGDAERPPKRRRGPARHDTARDMRKLWASLREEEEMARQAIVSAPNNTPADLQALHPLMHKHRRTVEDLAAFGQFVARSEFARRF